MTGWHSSMTDSVDCSVGHESTEKSTAKKTEQLTNTIARIRQNQNCGHLCSCFCVHHSVDLHAFAAETFCTTQINGLITGVKFCRFDKTGIAVVFAVDFALISTPIVPLIIPVIFPWQKSSARCSV